MKYSKIRTGYGVYALDELPEPVITKGKTVLLAKKDNAGQFSIYSKAAEREIKFNKNAHYAVVLADCYSGKKYTTHATMNAAAKQAKSLTAKKSVFQIIDRDGNFYYADNSHDGNTTLSRYFNHKADLATKDVE